LPITNIAVQKPSLWKHALTSNPVKQDSKESQPIRTHHSIDWSWRQSRKTWGKDVSSLNKAVYGARQPNAIRHHSKTRIDQW